MTLDCVLCQRVFFIETASGPEAISRHYWHHGLEQAETHEHVQVQESEKDKDKRTLEIIFFSIISVFNCEAPEMKALLVYSLHSALAHTQTISVQNNVWLTGCLRG